MCSIKLIGVFVLHSGNRIDATLVSRHKELQREVCELTEAEEQLDELISKCNVQLRLLTEEPQNKKYPLGDLMGVKWRHSK